MKELFDSMEKKPIKKVPIEEIPKGPGVCEVCDKHVDNLNLHMCDEHKVTYALAHVYGCLHMVTSSWL